jgi:hypothetical protein
MRRNIVLAAASVLASVWAAAPVPAFAITNAPMDSIYLCVDADGHKSYQNSSDGSSCRRVDGVVATIPSADIDRGRASARPVPARPTLSPASFPRVDVNTQRTRDADRRRILQEELRIEQEHLSRLQVEFNKGRPQPASDEAVGSNRYVEHVQRLFDDIERSQGNIASLQRELTPTRY